MKTLISLVSEQTLPNVLFAKEKGSFDRYVFIYTQAMVSKLTTLRTVLGLALVAKNEKEVIEDSLENIATKLNELSFGEQEEITINLTGGTKIMAIGVYNFFVKKNCSIFYIPFPKNEIVQVYPETGEKVKLLNYQVSLAEYLKCYDVKFEMNSFNHKNQTFSKELTKSIFRKNKEYNFRQSWKELQDKQIKDDIEQIGHLNLTKDRFLQLKNALQMLNYVPLHPNRLSENEIKYFAGGWWEEFVYHLIKTKLGLSDTEIGLNIEINRDNIPRMQAGNEFDLLFVKNNRLYVIECKTGINNSNKSGIQTFNEYVYKLAALRKYFGLGVKLVLFVLQPILQGSNRNFLLDRTKDLNIQLFDGNVLNDIDKFIVEIQK